MEGRNKQVARVELAVRSESVVKKETTLTYTKTKKTVAITLGNQANKGVSNVEVKSQ